MEGICPDCGGELCDAHNNCAEDCAFTMTDECDCFTWGENLDGTQHIIRDLKQEEPTHTHKWPVYK